MHFLAVLSVGFVQGSDLKAIKCKMDNAVLELLYRFLCSIYTWRVGSELEWPAVVVEDTNVEFQYRA